MKTYEKQKNRYQLCLLLFNNNVDLKQGSENTFWPATEKAVFNSRDPNIS